MRLEINLEKMNLLMEQKGWDEKKMADAIGVSLAQVYRVLRKQREPGNVFIAGLLHACGDETWKDLFIFADSLPKGNIIEEAGG